jgi:predicted DCC family thiol-disulfide oxidoreductase YuxK
VQNTILHLSFTYLGTKSSVKQARIYPVERILFFDGVCNLCNGTVQWILRHDKAQQIQFAALQSDAAKHKLEPLGIDNTKLESMVFLEDGVAYSRSTGVLRLARALGAPYSWAYVLMVLPQGVRDFFYRILAKNRYRWFGQRESCMMPTPELKRRFLS